MEIVVALVVGTALGYLWGVIKASMRLARAISRLVDSGLISSRLYQQLIDQLNHQAPLDEPPGESKIFIKLEKYGDMLYAFRKDNDQFVGQGSNASELIEQVKKTFVNCPSAEVVVAPKDGADLFKL